MFTFSLLTIAKKALFNRPWKYFYRLNNFKNKYFFLTRNWSVDTVPWLKINPLFFFLERRARTVACHLETISTWNVISPFTTVKLASYYFCLQFCDWILLWFVDKVSTHKNYISCPNSFVSSNEEVCQIDFLIKYLIWSSWMNNNSIITTADADISVLH